jgi:DNA-binding transcriptional LysR family regulator
LELRELAAFVSVCEHRSFTRAAEELCLSQPAVTRQIAALEADLRTRLFERLGRDVQLTTSGMAMQRYAKEMLRLASEARRAVGDVVSGEAGRLAVGANSTTATYLLPRVLREFREKYPGVELAVHTGVSSQVAEMVQANSVDLGIVTGHASQEGLIAVALTEYEIVAVAFPEHPLANAAAPVHTNQLSGCPLILMEEGTNLRRYVDRLLSTAGVEERVSVTMELDNVEAIKKMIEARLGISLLPLISVEAEVESGRLVAIPLADMPAASRRISAIYRQDKYVTASIRAFLDLLAVRL